MNIQIDLSEQEGLPTVTLRAAGNLQVRSWDQLAFRASTSDDNPTIEHDEEEIVLASRGDLVVDLPTDTALAIKAGGDASVQEVMGDLSVTRIGGNLALRETNSVEIDVVGGDASVQEVMGDLRAARIGGNLALREAHNVEIDVVGGDLDVREGYGSLAARRVGGNATLAEIHGAIAVNTAGDLVVRESHGAIVANSSGNAHLEIAPEQSARVNAGGDIVCELDGTTGANIKVVCGGEMQVEHSGGSMTRQHGIHSLSTGAGDASLSLVAGGNVVLRGVGELNSERSTSQVYSAFEEEMQRLGEEMGRFGADLGSIGAEIGQELGAAGVELGREFGSLGQKIADKVSRKLHSKFEREMRKADRQRRRHGRAFAFSMPEAPRPPRPPRAPSFHDEEANDPVSEEERMMILRMVEDGKISASEAERLLAALEGEYPDTDTQEV